MEPDVYEKNVGKKFVKTENFHKEWRYKDTSIYMLRPMNKLTRREVKALRDIIENPENIEDLKNKHPIIEETERRFD